MGSPFGSVQDALDVADAGDVVIVAPGTYTQGVQTRRPGTEAATMGEQVPDELKRERRDRIMALQQGISKELQRSLVGRRVDVLVEGRAEETEHLLAGRNAQQAPEIDGVTYLNDFAEGIEPGISGRNNLQTLAVCEMLVRSARERRPVERAELD